MRDTRTVRLSISSMAVGRLLGVALLLVTGGALGLAQGETRTLSGHIVDKACSARVSKSEDPQQAASKHTRKCALMENCKASCYGLYADGKYYEFDEKGCELAKGALEKSTKESGAVFVVVGKVDGSTITVTSLSERN
jgi:hypothetical protein